ncbi:adenylate kinase [Marinigracilibium pacificum]|uniref:Adenylate kinase n=1 Tax=Marinigracilibium pacificum TaxID=2729599 RepID=A0A848J2E1_9BACT|nr:adenylate kinase [Marinigracilibium pacificum]NMM48710.1 adenylate kinase [Marinigracilibium pacificum]
MLNIVLFGPPGAGKGTQSAKLIEKYNLTHISTGDLFRKHLGEGTELGKKAQTFMDQGRLVPDSLVIDMVRDKIKGDGQVNGIIFDGFPRTVAQAEALDQLMSELETDINGMVALEVPEDELRNRIMERGKTSGRTDDQDSEKVTTRIQVYEKETLPVAEFYKKQDKFFSINGVGSIEEIFNNICGVIDQVK